jgi:hypothetical protein
MKERAGARAFVGTPQYAILYESLRAPCIAGHPHCGLRSSYNQKDLRLFAFIRGSLSH